MPKVSIIIPSMEYKRKKNLKHFFKKLTSLPDLVKQITELVTIDYELIVICNGQKDKKLVNFIQKSKDIHKYAILSANAGVSRAWNIGRNLAEGDALLILNDDARIEKGSIELLYEKLYEKDDVVQVGPKGSRWEGSSHVDFVEEGETNVIAGFCFMTKTKIFDQLGGIDVFYTPAGFEEIDYSYKIQAANLKSVVVPNSGITTEPAHGISARNTTIKYFENNITTGDLHLRNKEYFEKKWCQDR